MLYEGHRVRFEVEESDRGPRAVTVVVITGTETVDGAPAAPAAAPAAPAASADAEAEADDDLDEEFEDE